jgi:predicted hydrolase (HD superfamily)
MDGDYLQNEDEEKFEQSLFVHTTVSQLVLATALCRNLKRNSDLIQSNSKLERSANHAFGSCLRTVYTFE